MSSIKTIAVTFLAWGTLASFADAAPASWFGSSNLSAWYANRSYANGGFYAPSTSPAPMFTNTGWFNSAAYLSSVGSPVPPTIVASPPPPSSRTPVDAFVNLGSTAFEDSSSLTSGNPQPWYNSTSVTAAFGGTPTSSQQADFVASVLNDVQRTFQLSGVNISLTSDASVKARHTLSVVSGTAYPSNPNAIGITTVGGNGFGFIDKLSYAKTPDELAMAVAHNVSHELMHALGVGSHPDTTGAYIDAATANWSTLIDPNTKFSPESVQLILAAARGSSSLSNGQIDGAQLLETPVPEPATCVLWSLSALGAMALLRRKPGQCSG